MSKSIHQKQYIKINRSRCLSAAEELSNFQNYLLLMIKIIEFRKINKNFQEKLNNDIKDIKNSDKVSVSPDKSRHVYK